MSGSARAGTSGGRGQGRGGGGARGGRGHGGRGTAGRSGDRAAEAVGSEKMRVEARKMPNSNALNIDRVEVEFPCYLR
jgi:hypothetical protein